MFKKIMKKVVFFSGALLIAGLVTQFVSERAVYAYQSNPIQSDSNSGSHAEFQWVYNQDSIAHEVGDVVVISSNASGGTFGLSVHTTATEGDSRVVGVIVENDIPGSSWGKIQTRGFVAVVTMANDCNLGEDLITSTTLEGAVSTGSVSAAQLGGVFGVALVDGTNACSALLK